MSLKQCHWCGILNWIKLNVSKVKWTNSTLTCYSCQQTRKEATTELLSNEKFIVSFVSLLSFNLRIVLANFTADEPSTSLLDDYRYSSWTLPSFNSWSFFIFMSSSLVYSQWYHAWESNSPAMHSVVCDNDCVPSHLLFPEEPRTLIYSFIHSFIRSFFQTLFFKTTYITNFPRGK